MMQPWITAVCAAAVLLIYSALRSNRQMHAWLGTDPDGARRAIRTVLGCAALLVFLLGGSIAGQIPEEFSDDESDLVLAMDLSASMDADDVAPSRLRRAIRAAEHLMDHTEGQRVGLVGFAGSAFTLAPLTYDHDAIRNYLAALDSELHSHAGSDLARALRHSIQTFDARSSRTRTLVLFSDGEHAGGDIVTAAAAVRTAGIHLALIGLGNTSGTTLKNVTDDRGRNVFSRREDASLRSIAEISGGTLTMETDGIDAAQLITRETELAVSHSSRNHQLTLTIGILLLLLLLELGAAMGSIPGGWLPRLVPIAAVMLTACPASPIHEGDLFFGAGKPGDALSKYRAAERMSEPDTPSKIRVGNALYRLKRWEPATSAYLDTLRHLNPSDREHRFVANFNLGNTLLQRQRYQEAKDAFWTAMLEEPNSVAAKYNYEWASKYSAAEEPPIEMPPTEQKLPSEDETQSAAGQAAAGEREASISEAEALRWMQSMDEEIREPLAKQLQAQTPVERGGQRW